MATTSANWTGNVLILIFVILTGSVTCNAPGHQGNDAPAQASGKDPVAFQDSSKPPFPETTSLTSDPLRNLLVISTLDGSLTALDRASGAIRWVSHDKPMIQVPQNNPSPSSPSDDDAPQNHSKLPKAPYFLPDPKTGSLYMMGKQNSLRKLPFTIPQLVAMAPCKNSEGIMYTGKKMDMWLTLNPFTGEKSEVPMDGSETCPKWSTTTKTQTSDQHHCASEAKPKFLQSVLIGKTEYTLSMMDGPRKWNVTYHHYSSNDMSQQSLQDYDQVYFTSPSEGRLITYQRKSTDLLWQVHLNSPVVGLYVIDDMGANLISVPFNPMASDTLERLRGGENSNKALNPTTYVGECAYGIYAVPAMADESVFLIGNRELPPLLEGPDTHPAHKIFGGGATHEGDYLLLGYYADEQGSGSGSHLPLGLTDGSATEPSTVEYNDSKIIAPPPPAPPQNNPTPTPPLPDSSPKRRFPPLPIKKPTKEEFTIVFTTAIISIGITSIILGSGFIIYRRNKNKELEMQQKLLSSDSIHSGERSSSGRSYSSSIDLTTGELTVGKITLFPAQVLGKGCEGTFVFKGKFEGRDVAVKRILPECFNLADREVDLLKESDQHVNVIRYFCTETDGQFRYIALELCVATLSDWVEGRWKAEDVEINGVDVLKDATEGLDYLHSLRIVHRDVKPANVLLSLGVVGGKKKVRTMISDFGLCKKIRDGRGSYSRRSGGVPGTDGWIAPEVVHGMETGNVGGRMTYSVDIFSMGCVYYYVLTGGRHPFGDAFRRQFNIIKGDYDIEQIEDNTRGAYNLVRAMISTNASERPPLRAILTHPFFWSSDKVLTFFLDVSDRIEKASEDSFPVLRRLEERASDIVKGDWRDHICSHVALDLRKYRTYKGDNLRDLLRALRNKKNHYRELTTDAQESLGTIPDGFVEYWVSRFPSLLEHVYGVFEACKRDTVFARYYDLNHEWDGEAQDYDMEFFRDGGTDSLKSDENPVKKVGKDFWKSKNQAKYQRWRNNNRGRGSPQKKSDASPRPDNRDGDGLNASTDNYWRSKSPGKENKLVA